MSERLEEMKEKYNYDESLKRIAKDPINLLNIAVPVNLKDFMDIIEQAEQVDKLGKVVDKQSQVILRQDSELDVMEQQNKCYREYFQKIINTDERLVDKQHFKDIANEALESESNA